ncbi:hypothetical protein Tco_0628155 [Tanacetum coccineum]|uniref:Uncharacterized protein n=1 Tax=Tanacetum coccineum TaxID=301880 RepID=A0ABQ4WPP3_9ASTR
MKMKKRKKKRLSTFISSPSTRLMFKLRGSVRATIRLKRCPILIQPLTGSYQLVVSLRALVERASDLRIKKVTVHQVCGKCFHFGPSKYEDPQGALLKLLQLGTIKDYQREVEKLMNRVTGISDSLLISFYIPGLKLHLQRELLSLKPLTLGYVFLLARMMEARLEDNRSTTTIAKPNYVVHVQHLEETTFHKSNKVEETEARVEATVHKEKETTEKEETVKETSDTLTSLQSEVASLEAKGSVDANEEIKKDHKLVHELEKQVEKLLMELQLKNNIRGI